MGKKKKYIKFSYPEMRWILDNLSKYPFLEPVADVVRYICAIKLKNFKGKDL